MTCKYRARLVDSLDVNIMEKTVKTVSTKLSSSIFGSFSYYITLCHRQITFLISDHGISKYLK
jgi:hypothetical protein